MRVPSGLKEAKLTQEPCPLSSNRTVLVATSQTRAVRSSEVVMMRSPVGSKRKGHRAAMAFERGEERSRLRVPDAGGRIFRSGHNTVAVGTEPRGIEPVLMAIEYGEDRARIPDTDFFFRPRR